MNNKVTSIFITATDTDAGKTYVSEKLIQLLTASGLKISAFKPVSAGCEWQHGELQNQDALCLQAAANTEQPLSEINPIAFEPPIAPHIAAAEQGLTLTVADVRCAYKPIVNRNNDVILVEGAGGWRLPLNDSEFMSDFVKSESIPVILVVGMKLGCLNHAMLTYQAMINDGINVVGWVANQAQAEKMTNHQENIHYLKNAINAPCLGELNFNDGAEALDNKQLLSIFKA
ncbi:dethiobiotin synthase [Thalassotalea sp. PS06]|uniref:dethiobiotin synthase n=1 Tax=Thalassotalea sp. PS06 TaxID=2594005 RepID=UPI001165C7B9|nr:dethiobiotin synthase [Thalassotalea sp. PS06]QDP01313.1 dethiobiotin synthase [Thalassotalea sp. PS06]